MAPRVDHDLASFRFFSAAVDLDAAARACVEGSGGLGLVATTGTEAHVVGHAAYVPTGGDHAEVAFAVADDWQGHGISTILLAHLAEAAATEGITTFTATVLPANHRMISVFRDSGFPVEVRSHPGELEVLLPTTLDEAGRRRFEDRERDASVAAVSHVLRPASVAVVGASRRPGTVGGEVMRSLLAGGFTGSLYALNHTRPRSRAYPPSRASGTCRRPWRWRSSPCRPPMSSQSRATALRWESARSSCSPPASRRRRGGHAPAG